MRRHARTKPSSSDPALAQAFAEATDLHKHGRLAEAEQRYLALLRRQPRHAATLHAFGLLRAQQHRLDDAIKLLRQATERDPRIAEAHDDLGAALQAARRPAEALTSHRAAIGLKPDFAKAHYNLGAAFHALGRADAALGPYQTAVALAPDLGAAHHNLGDALLTLGRADEAAASFANALTVHPEVADTHNKLGMALIALRRREAAVACFQRATTLRPDHIEAQNNLGALLHELGRTDEAAQAFAAAFAANPNQADLHSNLAVVLGALGRHADAAEACARALALNPDLAEAHNNLGSALRELGRHNEALPHFERAVALRPAYPEALNNLGSLLHDLSRHDEAVAAFERVLTHSPEHVDAHNNLGAALASLQRPQEALPWFERAIALRPDYIGALVNMAVALSRLHREQDAAACLERALAIDPNHADTQREWGALLRTLGRFDEARRAIETAVALEPGRIEHHYALSAVKRFSPDDPQLEAMEALARAPDVYTEERRAQLHFALGKAYADIGERTRSFEHLLEANALKRRITAYDEAATLDWFYRVPRRFTPAAMARLSGAGAPSRAPIFIVGMPRSGTTLVEQILASHPAVFGAGEIEAFRRTLAALTDPDGAPLVFPELIDVITSEQVRALGTTYLSHLEALAPGASRVTDKLPLNFSCAGLIHLALPGARIIHVRRNPIDTCLSCFSLEFAGHQPFTYELGELARYYRAYEAVMAHWRAVLPDGVMLEVRYEDVVDDLEREARRLIAHCGLDWDPACLEFHRIERPVRTASVDQVRRPIYRTSVARWRPYAHLLTPLFDALGVDAPDATAPTA